MISTYQYLIDAEEQLRSSDLIDLLLDDSRTLDPRRAENHWVSIYPPLRKQTELPSTMLENWASAKREEISFLYLHIPFCAKHCKFCYFHITTNYGNVDEYLRALKEECMAFLSVLSSKSTRVSHLYLGGGTPSSIDPKRVANLFASIFDAIPTTAISRRTLEIHPATLNREYLQLCSDGIFSRVSMGVQSFNRDLLLRNNRIHADFQLIAQIAESFHSSGITEINIDLMTGLDGQVASMVAEDIRMVDLLIQRGVVQSVTVYPRSFTENSKILVGDLDCRALLDQAVAELAFRNYFGSVGWTEFPTYYFSAIDDQLLTSHAPQSTDRIEKLGFGNSAYSHFDNTNYRNLNSILDYTTSVTSSRAATACFHQLSALERIARQAIFGIKSGLVDAELSSSANYAQDGYRNLISQMIERGWCEPCGSRYGLTGTGRLMTKFIMQQVEKIFDLSETGAL
jgi:coproporphyrinogen III oxidase-like Fe-S oxidoreductase